MDAWVWWIIIAVIFAVGEIATVSFFLGPFALGALLAAGVDAVGGGTLAAWSTFIVTSLLALLVARPIAKRHLYTPPTLRTGTAALVGESAIVTQRIANGEDCGAVKLAGEVWTARAYDDEDGIIEAGKRVHVVEIRGATALVSET